MPVIEQIFQDVEKVRDLVGLLHRVLDAAIEVAGAEKGTLQRLDEETGRLKIFASRGFSDEVLNYFATVHRDSNTTCAATLKRRMRVWSWTIFPRATCSSAHRSLIPCSRRVLRPAHSGQVDNSLGNNLLDDAG
jgi:hypothetical protein